MLFRSFLADHAWKLLPLYRFDAASGLWHHREGNRFSPVTLEDLRLPGKGDWQRAPESALPSYLGAARRIVERAETNPPADVPPLHLPDEFERLRWFPLPSEALARLALGTSR